MRRFVRLAARLSHRVTRDCLLFAAGCAGLLHETCFVQQPRDVLVMVFAAFMTAPAVLRTDEWLTKGRG